MPNTLDIDLWFWRLEATAADLARWATYLDDAEQARMARFLFEKDRTRFTVCRSRLRRILGWYTRTPPRDITFATTGRNKPVLSAILSPILSPAHAATLEFNLTHTTGFACLAISQGTPVGVDLEQVRPVDDDFIAHTLTPAEAASVLPREPAARRDAFFEVWTAKEAYLKCLGTGLFQSLATFDVAVPEAVPDDGPKHGPAATSLASFAPAHLTRIDDDAQRHRPWQLWSFRATATHIGALAIAPPSPIDIRIRPRWIGT